MKPNEPFSRNRLLDIVENQLRNSASVELSLTDTVREIMDSVNPHDRFSHSNRPAADEMVDEAPIPLGDVAAYVDGTLADQNVEQRITSAATGDEGLMLEIVMAIKSREDELSARPIPNVLRSRLIELRDASINSTTEPNVDPLDAVLPKTLASPLTVPSEVGVAGEYDKKEQSVEPFRRSKSTSRQMPIVWAVLAVATLLLIGIGWWASSGWDQGTPIVRDPDALDSVDPTHEPSPDTLLVEDDLEFGIPDLDPAPRDISPDLEMEEPQNEFAIDDPSGVEPTTPQPMIVEVPESEPNNGMPMTMGASGPLVATWSQIDGLLLQSERQLAPEASISSAATARSVTDGTTLSLAGTDESTLRLQVLPFCRATADLSEGGKLIIAGDTLVEMTPDGAIDLRYGSIALLGLGEEAEVRLGRDARRGVPVRSREGGSLLVSRTVNGLEIDVVDHPVEIAGKRFDDSKVHVNPTTKNAMRMADAPERLPKWTRERVDRIELGRNVLASLATANNVGPAIRSQLKSGNVRGQSALLLRQWFVASHRDHLLRLFSAEDALLRESALMYLRNTRPNDPRHRELWQRLRILGQNNRTLTVVR
ncbi:MAG: hypothetical protein AAF497_25810, partial [Planctomycetota bacterium]